MGQLWRSTSGLCILASLIAGCAHREIEGAWIGAYPLDEASDCRVQLLGNHTFDLTCRNSGSWKANGTYRFAGDRLTLTFVAAWRDGNVARPMPSPTEFKISPSSNRDGNTLCWSIGTEAETCWHRASG